jgi:hypothetical protein
MAFNIREHVDNPSQSEFQRLYDLIDRLVNDAGHVTIAQLFTTSGDEIGSQAWDAIQAAKGMGFLNFSNQRCCSNNKCVKSDRGWCNQTANKKCSAASDVCKL